MLVGYLLFKQKTAYEMRISDWSSDVCSSDLEKEVRAASVALEGVQQEAVAGQRTVLDILNAEQDVSDAQVLLAQARHDLALARFDVLAAIGRLSARGQIGRAHVCTPVTNAHLVCRLLLEKNKLQSINH